MRSAIILTVALIPFNLYANCGGVLGANHINPDGGQGGFVANTAAVAKTVTIQAASQVCDKAKIEGYTKVLGSSKISGETIIEGNALVNSSKVSGSAHVFGSGQVVNSTVCQASQINFNVSNSEYYCQNEDSEPSHPGELGDKTLLGIDSDVDGIRDDVEIWINNNTSNTPNKDYRAEREYLKDAARELQNAIKHKDTRSIARDHVLKALSKLECLGRSKTMKEKSIPNLLKVETFQTMPRLHAWAKLDGYLHGMSSEDEIKDQCAL